MKLKPFFLILFLFALSCEKTDDNPLNNSDINKIKEEVKSIVDKIYDGCEKVNPDEVLENCYDSSDFTYLFNGTTLTYKEFSDDLKSIFSLLSKQDITRSNEKIVVLGDATVLYTVNCKFLQDYKNATKVTIDPASMLFIFKKIAGNWLWIYGVESYGHY